MGIRGRRKTERTSRRKGLPPPPRKIPATDGKRRTRAKRRMKSRRRRGKRKMKRIKRIIIITITIINSNEKNPGTTIRRVLPLRAAKNERIKKSGNRLRLARITATRRRRKRDTTVRGRKEKIPSRRRNLWGKRTRTIFPGRKIERGKKRRKKTRNPRIETIRKTIRKTTPRNRKKRRKTFLKTTLKIIRKTSRKTQKRRKKRKSSPKTIVNKFRES